METNVGSGIIFTALHPFTLSCTPVALLFEHVVDRFEFTVARKARLVVGDCVVAQDWIDAEGRRQAAMVEVEVNDQRQSCLPTF